MTVLFLGSVMVSTGKCDNMGRRSSNSASGFPAFCKNTHDDATYAWLAEAKTQIAELDDRRMQTQRELMAAQAASVEIKAALDAARGKQQ